MSIRQALQNELKTFAIENAIRNGVVMDPPDPFYGPTDEDYTARWHLRPVQSRHDGSKIGDGCSLRIPDNASDFENVTLSAVTIQTNDTIRGYDDDSPISEATYEEVIDVSPLSCICGQLQKRIVRIERSSDSLLKEFLGDGVFEGIL